MSKKRRHAATKTVSETDRGQSSVTKDQECQPPAMHHLPDKAMADHLNLGLVTHTGLIHGRCTSQRVTPVVASPIFHKQ